MPAVLIVDDLLSIHEMLDAVIQPTGFATAFATDGEKALVRYKAERFDLVLADVDMKPMDGITLLKQLKLYDPNCVVIIMTAYASMDSAIQALKYGAFDYLQKPFRVDELIATLKRGMEFRQFNAERTAHSPPCRPGEADDIEGRLVGQGAKSKKLIQQIKKLCAVRTPVLLAGEAGTGKGTVADILHKNGEAPESPLVRIDCGAELGAGFPGRAAGPEWQRRRLGAAGQGGHAAAGTHPVPAAADAEGARERAPQHQSRLPPHLHVHGGLGGAHGRRALQRRALLSRRVAAGGVAAAARAAGGPAGAGQTLHAQGHQPPVRRPNLIEFTDDALAVFRAYHWPGNLAELEQLVSKIVATTEMRVVTSQQLPMRLREVRHWPTLAEYLAGQQKQYVDMVLHACQDDKARAAQVLGVDAGKLG